MEQIDNTNSSTRICVCGSQITWEGFDDRLDEWMAIHKDCESRARRDMDEDEYTERMNAELDGWELDRKLAEAHRRGALEAIRLMEMNVEGASGLYYRDRDLVFGLIRDVRSRYEEKAGE